MLEAGFGLAAVTSACQLLWQLSHLLIKVLYQRLSEFLDYAYS